MLTLLFTVAMAQEAPLRQLQELPVVDCIKAVDTDTYRVVLTYSFGKGGAPESVTAVDDDGRPLRSFAQCIERAFLELEPLGEAVANQSYEIPGEFGRPLHPSSPIGKAPFLPTQHADRVSLEFGLSAEEAAALGATCDEPSCQMQLRPGVRVYFPGVLGHLPGVAATLVVDVPTSPEP